MTSLDLCNPVLAVAIEPWTVELLHLPSSSKSALGISRITAAAAEEEEEDDDGFFSLTKTSEEISILATTGASQAMQKLCHEAGVSLLAEPTRWKALRIVGPLELSMVGVLHEFITPLKHGKIPIFVSSTFLTDYILVKVEHIENAVSVLKEAGWMFKQQ